LKRQSWPITPVAEKILVDAGPLVAVLNASDQHHGWARQQFDELQPPLLTCEAVLSEAQFLVHRLGGDPLCILELVESGVLHPDFDVGTEVGALLGLQRTYRNLPMSLADACLVRMTEAHERARVFTTDSHFRIYRRIGRRLIPLLAPPGI